MVCPYGLFNGPAAIYPWLVVTDYVPLRFIFFTLMIGGGLGRGEGTEKCFERRLLMNKAGFEAERKCLHKLFFSFYKKLSFLYMTICSCCHLFIFMPGGGLGRGGR